MVRWMCGVKLKNRLPSKRLCVCGVCVCACVRACVRACVCVCVTCTSIAYFVSWSPYTVVVLGQSFVSSFSPPSGVQFAAMWLANANSAVNVFIYSYTNKQFRRQCVLLASRICCFRSSGCSSPENRPNLSAPPPAINLSTTNVTPPGTYSIQ